MKNRNHYLLALALFTVATVVSFAGQPQQSPKATSKHAAVHSIVLPQYSPELPQGPHLETYVKDCLICHSARYVSMQPRFSQAVWEKEVKKMVDAYGAAIPEADQHEIVEYLVAVHGPEQSK